MPGRNTSPPRRLVSDELWALIEPQAILILITRWVFLTVRLVLGLLAGRKDYRGRDRVLALGGPFGLLALPVAWLVLVLVAYLVGLLAAARRARGIRAGSRALSCWRRGAIEGYS